MNSNTYLASAVLAAIAAVGTANAQIKENDAAAALSWESSQEYASATLKLSGPDGFVTQRHFGADESLYFDLSGQETALADGLYHYELVLNPKPLLRGADAEVLNDLRKDGVDTGFAATMSPGGVLGSFSIVNGKPVDAGMPEGFERKDIVQNDDLIVTFSLCVGNDCVNGESFGFDTLRLKENNLRIHFNDTSSSASFPTNDWRIVINDSSNGGSNYFAVEDSNAGRQVFRVDAGAPANALRVDSGGDLGIGESAPVTELHISDGDSPTMRLEQDGTSGFTPQTWDVAGNETNFFVRDVTNGSRLPFRIRPGAPSDSIFISPSGRTGFGEDNPADALHITNVTDSSEQFIGIRYQSSQATWRTLYDTSGDRFLITKSGSGGSEMIIEGNTGNVTIRGGLISTGAGGACTVADPCDGVFDTASYQIPSIDDHAAQMWENGYLPAVGPTLPDQPVDVTLKLLRMLNELEKAHVYIEQLHKRIDRLEQQAD